MPIRMSISAANLNLLVVKTVAHKLVQKLKKPRKPLTATVDAKPPGQTQSTRVRLLDHDSSSRSNVGAANYSSTTLLFPQSTAMTEAAGSGAESYEVLRVQSLNPTPPTHALHSNSFHTMPFQQKLQGKLKPCCPLHTSLTPFWSTMLYRRMDLYVFRRNVYCRRYARKTP